MPSKYVRYFTSYVDHLLRDNDTPYPTREDADRIAMRVLSSEYSKSYQKHLLIALECYMEYIGTPVTYKKPRQTKRSPKYLTQDQMKKLVRGARDYRSLALLIMFSTTGIRLNELRMLDIGDVYLERRVLTVRHAKRDKDREIPLSEDCVKVLRVYSDKCHKKNAKPTEPYFRSQRGNRWSAHAIETCVERGAERAGLKGMVSPHVLRHSFATAMVSNGCDIFHLSSILGHSDISTTSIYLHLNSDARRAAYERGVPRF